MVACAREPPRDSGVVMAKDACRSRNIQSFGQGREHFAHAMSWGLEPVEWRIAARTERDVTGLTAEGLDPLMPPLVPVAYQCMNLGIPNLIIGTPTIGAGEALGGDAFGRTTAAFAVPPWTNWRADTAGGRGSGLLPADRAIIWRARPEEPPNGCSDGGAGWQGRMAALPTPDQPCQAEQQQQDQTA